MAMTSPTSGVWILLFDDLSSVIFRQPTVILYSIISYIWLVLVCLNHITLILYTCDCLCTPLDFILCTCWVIFWQSWTCKSRFQSAAKAWWKSSMKTLDFFVKHRISHNSFLTCLSWPAHEISLCSSWVSSSLLYFVIISLCLLWCNIHAILDHTLW